MDSTVESQLKIKLHSNVILNLIEDDESPKSEDAQALSMKNDLILKLDLISEDRERLKKTYQDLIKERIGLINDIKNRKNLHKDLKIKFAQKRQQLIKELELENKILTDVCLRKKMLLGKMKGLLQQSPKQSPSRLQMRKKENSAKDLMRRKENSVKEGSRKRVFDFEGIPVKKIEFRESLSPATNLSSLRRQKIAAFRNSLCN